MQWVITTLNPDAEAVHSWEDWEKLSDPTIRRRPSRWKANKLHRTSHTKATNKRHRTSHTTANAPQLSSDCVTRSVCNRYRSNSGAKVEKFGRKSDDGKC